MPKKSKKAGNSTDEAKPIKRTRAGDAIQEVRDIYCASVKDASIAILLLGDEGTLLGANKRAEELTGFTSQELKDLSPSQLYPKEKMGEFTAALKNGRKQKVCYMDNMLLLRKGGEIIPVDLIGNMLEYEGKHILQIIILDDRVRKQAEEILSESEERYRSIINATAEGFWLINPRLETIEANESLCRMLEYSREEMLGKKPFDFTDEENRKIFEEQTSKIPGTTHRNYDIVLKSKSGKDVYCRFHATTVRDSSSNITSAFAFVTDITELKLVENSLLESKERMEQLYKVIPSAVFTVDTDRRIQSFNKKAEDITGYNATEVIGKDCSVFALNSCVKNCALFSDELQKPIMGKECGLIRKDGEIRILSKNMDLIRDIKGNIIGGVESFEDVTERKQDEETLNYLAYYDALTGLPNRRLFYDRFEMAVSSAKRNREMLAIIFLDLDNFKTVNDTLGHIVGDQLIQAVADRLRKTLRGEDTVARLGGDEFILLIKRASEIGEIAKVAQRAISALKPPFYFNNREFYITASAGIAVYPNDGNEVHDLLRNADIALYRAKEQGRDNYQFYAPTMGDKAIDRLTLENNLHKALDREEFLLYYQPIVDLNSGRISRMEALLRWQHPNFGLVYPSDFIPALEETGLIMPVGEWVLRTACNQARAWQEKGLIPVRVAVNLSPKQFQQKGLVEMISDVLGKTDLSPDYLEIEITENAVMGDIRVATETFYGIKEIGVQVSFDDFATGYSSLSLLKKLPADTLKIDQSFISDIVASSNDKEIVKAIITLAHSLSIRAIAEGVETMEQLELLREFNCDEIQGYVFSRPLPAHEATELLAAEMRLCA